MSDLISKSALLASTDKEEIHKYEIALFPTIDAVPVVRCKDCKYWRANTQFCGMFSGFGTSHRMPPNAFCSLAERRTDG